MLGLFKLPLNGHHTYTIRGDKIEDLENPMNYDCVLYEYV